MIDIRKIKTKYNGTLIRKSRRSKGITQTGCIKLLEDAGWEKLAQGRWSKIERDRERTWKKFEVEALQSVLGIDESELFFDESPFAEKAKTFQFLGDTETKDKLFNSHISELEQFGRTLFFSSFPSSVFFQKNNRVENIPYDYEYYSAIGFLDFSLSGGSPVKTEEKLEVIDKIIVFFQDGGKDKKLHFFNANHGSHTRNFPNFEIINNNTVVIIGSPFGGFITIHNKKLCEDSIKLSEEAEKLSHSNSLKCLEIMHTVIEKRGNNPTVEDFLSGVKEWSWQKKTDSEEILDFFRNAIKGSNLYIHQKLHKEKY